MSRRFLACIVLWSQSHITSRKEIAASAEKQIDNRREREEIIAMKSSRISREDINVRREEREQALVFKAHDATYQSYK